MADEDSTSAAAPSDMPRFDFPAAPLPGQGEEFGIDAELIKVLASDSRRDILRLLHQRRMTLTELAAGLDLKKATVLEHLKRLTDVGLIRRLDEDRLWVYYELTGRGKRVVNPGRTRFFLVFGASAAALALVGVILAAVVLGNLQGDSAQSAPLHTQVEDAAATRSGVAVDIRLADAASSRAYLVSESDLDSLRADGVVSGIPLSLAQSEGGVARYQSFSPVPAGTYFVYVVDAQGRDNLDDLASVRIPSLDVVSPAFVWKGFDEGAPFRVTRDGKPANGSLLLASGKGKELPVLEVKSGEAFLDAETLDRLVPANYSIQYLPQGERWWLTVGTFLDVREPLAVPVPAVIAEGRETNVTVFLGTKASGAPVTLDFASAGKRLPNERPSNEVSRIHLQAAPPGLTNFTIGRTLQRDLDVRADVAFAFVADVDADGVIARLALPDGTPLGGALLQVDGVDVGTTEPDGSLALPPIANGTHRFTAIADGEPVRIVSRAIHVEGWNFTAASDAVRLRAVTASALDGTLLVNTTLESQSVAPETGTLVVRVDNEPAAWSVVDLDALEARTASLAPDLDLAPGDHAVSAEWHPIERAPVTLHNRTSGDNVSTPPPRVSSSQWDVSNGSLQPQPGGLATNRTTLTLEDDASARSNIYRVVVPEPTPTPLSTSPAADSGVAPQAKTPGPTLLVALAAVALALAIHRRRRG